MAETEPMKRDGPFIYHRPCTIPGCEGSWHLISLSAGIGIDPEIPEEGVVAHWFCDLGHKVDITVGPLNADRSLHKALIRAGVMDD
jgi:hypothetical protein